MVKLYLHYEWTLRVNYFTIFGLLWKFRKFEISTVYVVMLSSFFPWIFIFFVKNIFYTYSTPCMPEYEPLLLLTSEQLLSVASFKKCKRLSLLTTSKICWEVRVLASFEAVISAVAVMKNSKNRSNALARIYIRI